MKQLLILIVITISFNVFVKAQDFTTDYTYEQSGNTRIIKLGKKGLMNKNQQVIIPLLYDDLSDFHNGYSRVVRNGKVGFVNEKGQEIIPCIYEVDTLNIIGATLQTVIYQNSEVQSLQVSVDEQRLGLQDSLFCVIQNGKYGFIDQNNKIIIPFQFDAADNFYNGVAIIVQNGKYGVIEKSGKMIVPFSYNLLVWSFESYPAKLYAQRNGQQYYYDQATISNWKRDH